MQINLDIMSMLAECQQNFHVPEHMKEGSDMYTYFSYPITNCDKICTPFFIFSRGPFHVLLCKVSNLHMESVCQYCAKIRIIHSNG